MRKDDNNRNDNNGSQNDTVQEWVAKAHNYTRKFQQTARDNPELTAGAAGLIAAGPLGAAFGAAAGNEQCRKKAKDLGGQIISGMKAGLKK